MLGSWDVRKLESQEAGRQGRGGRRKDEVGSIGLRAILISCLPINCRRIFKS